MAHAMKYPLIFCFLLIHFSSYAQHQVDIRFTGLDSIFAVILKDWKAPGFAVAVVEKGNLIYAKGFGYRDYENKYPVTAHTQFAIGSCTKAFTVSLLGILREIGLVDFDSAVINYIPELRFNTGKLTTEITVKDLITHRTGLARHDPSWYLWPSEDSDHLIKRIRHMKPISPLRSKWHYNNWSYFLLGVIGERITEHSWEQNMVDYFFRLLGMTESTTSWKESESYIDKAVGYRVKNDSIIDKMDYYHIKGLGAAGGIISTASDMARWVGIWTNGGKIGHGEFIPTRYFEEAISSQMVISGALPERGLEDLYFANYGYGWVISSYRGHYRVEHGGNIDGFTASTSFFPSDSIGIVVLANQNESEVPSIVQNILSDRLLQLDPKNWNKKFLDRANRAYRYAMLSPPETRKIAAPPSHPKMEYTGKYHHPAYGPLKIVLQQDSLIAVAGAGEFYLKHDHFDVYDSYLIDKTWGIDTTKGSKMQFYLNTSGEISGVKIDLDAMSPPLNFTKTIPEVKKKKLVYIPAHYIGTYVQDLEIKILMRNSELYIVVADQPDYELLNVDIDRFAIIGLSEHYVQFERDENDHIIALILQQPDGNLTAKKVN